MKFRAAERNRGARGKILFGGTRLKTGGQYSKALRVPITGPFMPLMQPLMPCTRPDFDGALFNFRIFLKLGAPTCLGPGVSSPPPLLAALLKL